MAAIKAKKKSPAGKTKPQNKAAKGKATTGKGKGKPAAAARAKAGPRDPGLNLGGVLVLSLVGFGLAATGLAVLDRGIELGIVRGRQGIADAAMGLSPALLAGTVGLLIAWMYTGRMRLVGAVVAAAILVGGAVTGASLVAPQMFQLLAGTVGPEGRQAALKGTFMHQLTAAGSFSAPDMPTEPIEPDAKLLMATLGAFGIFDPALYDRMDSNLIDMAETVTGRALDPDSAWASFRLAADETLRDYERYQSAANNYLTVVNSVDQQIAQLWNAVLQAARMRWSDYEQRQSRVLRQLQTRIPDLRDLLVVYFRVKQTGRRTAELDQRYQALSTELFGEFVDPQTWCGPTGCPGNQAFLSDRGAQVLSVSFARQNEDIGLGLNEAQYIAHPSVVAAIRAEVLEAGVNLPEDWALTVQGRDQLVVAARRDIPATARQTYESAIRGWFETELLPDLTYPDFVAQQGIQTIIRRTINLPTDLRIDPSIDRATFDAEIYPRIIRPPAEALAADVMAPVEDFDPNAGIGRLSTEVTTAMNTQFGLGFLIFAGALSGLVGGLIGLSASIAVIWRVVAGLINVPLKTVGSINRVIGLGAVFGLIAGLAVPLVMPFGLATYAGYGIAVQPTVAPPMGAALDWTMRSAQMLQPLGSASRGLVFGGSGFGLVPAPPESDAGFGFVFEISDELPEMMREPEDTGPSGISGLADRIDTLIENTTGIGADDSQ
ncbi:MAG: hypothetical protein AAF556_05115 [Pseudomonadota bacterium]